MPPTTTPWWRSHKVRLWLYGLGVATLPLLVGYGLLSEDQAPIWQAWLLALLAAGPPAVAGGTLARQLSTGQLSHDPQASRRDDG